MTVQFDEFVFDGGQRQLFRRGEPVSLEPKAFELLRLLVSRRPEAVPRADIHELLWAGALVSLRQGMRSVTRIRLLGVASGI